MIVLFAFLLALGIVVDDAIVVIENTHRIYQQEKNLTIIQAAKKAAGEVFLPVLSGTLTTLAPFFPLVFWKGIFGKFLHYLPVTVIITLTASLLVAYVINPIFAVQFMGDAKRENREVSPVKKKRRRILSVVLLVLVTFYFYSSGNIGMGNFVVFCLLFGILYKYVFSRGVKWFQNHGWPAVQSFYAKFLTMALRNPWKMLVGMTILFAGFLRNHVNQAEQYCFVSKGRPQFHLCLPHHAGGYGCRCDRFTHGCPRK